MKTKFEQTLEKLLPNYTNKKVYVAVSGGVDSMTLLDLCYEIGLKPTVLHCNFKLRGKESDLDEAVVQNYCESRNLDFKNIAFDTKKIAAKKKQSIQLCARELRYDWFNDFIEHDKNSVLFTAHHSDDAIETFFINLLRGTGIKGLIGIPYKRDNIYRPLLNFSKSEIIEFAERNSIQYRTDESNSDTNYTRNNIRHQIIPLLTELSPELAKKMNSLMHELKETDDFLDNYANESYKKALTTDTALHHLSADRFIALQYPIKLKILAKFGVQRNQLSEILKLCKANTGAMFSNKDYIFLKNRKNIIIRPNEDIKAIYITINSIPKYCKVGDSQLNFSFVDWQEVNFSTNTAYLNYELIKSSLVISNQTKGEKIQPLGMEGSKLISDIMTNAKMNRFEKENQLIIKHQLDTIWVVGKTIHHRYAISAETKKILKVELLE